MGVERVNIQFWDTELEYQQFAPESQLNFRSYLGIEWENAIKNEGLESTFNFLWSLRSLLWPEIITEGKMEVRFQHDGTQGSGYGPIFYFGNASKTKALPTRALMHAEKGLLLESTFFPFSDLFFGDYSEGLGFLGIDALQVDFISYDEHKTEQDEDLFEILFEHTFSADFRIEAKARSSSTWSALSEADQSEVIENLIEIGKSQLDEFGEYIQEPTDLLACVIMTKSTAPSVRQRVLSTLEELRLGFLTTISFFDDAGQK